MVRLAPSSDAPEFQRNGDNIASGQDESLEFKACRFKTYSDYRVFQREVTQSTNDDVRLLAIGDAVCANQQLRGRARSGRHWVSPPGNLYLSVKLAGMRDLNSSAMLSLVAGIAICDTVSQILGSTPADIKIKWPNDVLVNDRKIAGILLESEMCKNTLEIVIGMGVNVNSHPKDEIRPSTSLFHLLGQAVDLEKVLELCLTHLQKWETQWRTLEGERLISEAFCERAWTRETMTVKTPSGSVSGQFAGLKTHGHLRLKTEDGEIVLNSGDIIFPSNTLPKANKG